MNAQQLQESMAYIRQRVDRIPALSIILGSGLGSFADHLQTDAVISCRDIPHYPVSTVEGHAGLIYFGRLDDVPVMALKGRVHFYEGYTKYQVGYPVHLMAALGVRSLIVTNAAGAINTDFRPGDLMLITDHINFSFDNPLIGSSLIKPEERFADMCDAYHAQYRELALDAARCLGIGLKQGILFVTKGPCYETAAEIRMIRALGGDAGTMSTVPEVIVANQQRMKVLGISCITNMGTGILDQKLDHYEVTVVAGTIEATFTRLISEIIRRLGAI
ncbi:MAG: purine-nucleoside phosphorylase [candidate division KSB1 bacterium]|jgi:purine-nucleoside phosphorylase|nr:purine-nucleoside phosphorylase [candidate division KSB1 bacterium]